MRAWTVLAASLRKLAWSLLSDSATALRKAVCRCESGAKGLDERGGPAGVVLLFEALSSLIKSSALTPWLFGMSVAAPRPSSARMHLRASRIAARCTAVFPSLSWASRTCCISSAGRDSWSLLRMLSR